ncbi:hypothetical protein DMN91_001078 [Ooceraea biroi]|uniref:DOMON domain-containing protein n=1 Tax=Ooceraea biroi TaxID=2015173 RepID=A0A3L8E3L6_OOCBI|nr:MOXD1 homolog 1 [Ooceraea biroi]RLU27277.1 hypothetical protein DMN91_001078 [Ooceraea biroi]
MLLLRLIVTLVTCWIVKCDLLDLYVQHMDETMRTMLYRNKRHPMDPVSRRIKRSLETEPLLRVGNFKKQRLDVDEDWLKQWKVKKRIIPYKNDALDYSNKREENLDPDQHEILLNTTQKSKLYSEEMTTIFEDATDANYNIVRDKDEPPVVEDQTNAEDLTIEPLELEEEIAVEDWQDPEINKETSEFEIISENERINPKPFDDPSFKRKPWGSRAPKKYFPPLEKPVKDAQEARSHAKGEVTRPKRDTTKTAKVEKKRPKFTRYEQLDEDGDVILEWDPSDDKEVVFKVTARTLGYVGIGFNEKSHMKGADILLAWVDDTGIVNLLDSHGIEEVNAAPVTDTSQDVRVLGGSQNDTHTTVMFARDWDTCDPQDHQLTGDSIRVLWALHQTDPELNTAEWHGDRRGGKALRVRTAAAHSPPEETQNVQHWDIKLSQYNVSGDMDTIYWCKLFKAPPLKEKHHMIGYTPLVEKTHEDLVHHVILYECASTGLTLDRLDILRRQTRLSGVHCYSSNMPPQWESCLQPILAWARGSKGEWLPKHVGIPIAEHGEESYYMLEVHYNNPNMRKVIDSSGVRLHFTSQLRPQEAGILVTGVAVSPLHLVPPRQKEYATAGYCTPHCTNTMFPESGINIVSVVLHSHLAGRRLSLKHIRQGKELPRIVEDKHFDFDYQQSHSLEEEVNVLPGDELVAECVYSTLDRTIPTLGGYAASQEMCLAFVVHYPRTPLAACYSMTPVKDLFRTLGVNSFQGVTMDYLETLFLTTGTDLALSSNNQQQLSNNQQQLATYPIEKRMDKINVTLAKETEQAFRKMRENHESDNVFTRLIIEEPEEFKGRTLAEHMLALPWTEELLARSIENSLYHGKHMTFCRKRDDRLALPADIQTFPNYTALPEANNTFCKLKMKSGSSSIPLPLVINLVTIIIASVLMF